MATYKKRKGPSLSNSQDYVCSMLLVPDKCTNRTATNFWQPTMRSMIKPTVAEADQQKYTTANCNTKSYICRTETENCNFW